MLLVSASYAERTGIPWEIELLGYASTLDGYHITSPDPSGEGMRRAMEQALMSADLGAAHLDYVNFHGTGTRANDPIELLALSHVLLDHAPRVMGSSTKDRHGHLIAAAGIVEAAVVLLGMTHGLVPRTVNLDRPIDGRGVDLVTRENRKRRLDACMTNSFAFGGINSSLVFGRHQS
jgi:3-oxoacyl-[acyl-carrier-protein] synthase II